MTISKYEKINLEKYGLYKCFIIFLFLLFLAVITYILIPNGIKLLKCKVNLDYLANKNMSLNINKDLKILNSNLVINKPILPEDEKEIIIKKYLKSDYNTSNIRYHFEDLFLKRKLFKIDYSFMPYENLDKSKPYEINANYIYETTGMLNITKLDIVYYGKNNINTQNFNHIHLSMGHDSNYILYSLVSIASILNTTNNNTFIHFHFALINCKFEDMKPIISLKKIYKNIEFIFYNGKQAEYDFSRYGNKESRGIGDYTKFLLPEIVNNTNKIIILDSADIIALKDLSEIFYFDLEDNYFGFSLDILAGKKHKYFVFAKNKFYANIGVCLVNVLLFRKNLLYRAGYFARLAYDNLPCPTQEMFFMISNYKFKYFPLIYNCPQFVGEDMKFKKKQDDSPLIKSYLENQKNSIFKYTYGELIEAESRKIVIHLFTTKILAKKANKKNGKIWVNYAKLSNAYEKLKLKHPKIFQYYDV